MILAVKNLGDSVGKRLERKQKMWSLKWERQGNNTGMSKVILKMKKVCPNTAGNANKIPSAS